MQFEAASSHSHAASPSPSFSSYSSSETLADIAARVIEELRRDPHLNHDDESFFHPWQNDNDEEEEENDNDNDDDDDDFEFTFVSRDQSASPVSADDIFFNGQIRPMYPIFDRTLLLDDAVATKVTTTTTNSNPNAGDSTVRRRLPLRKLMFEERETASCSSSTSTTASEADELERVAEGSYCVWNPNSVSRKKSNSTGSASKRWKLRDLILRSHSEGKGHNHERVVFQVQNKTSSNKVANEAAKLPNSGGVSGGASVQNKRKSVLPYRQELVGLFANVNGLGRTLHPF